MLTRPVPDQLITRNNTRESQVLRRLTRLLNTSATVRSEKRDGLRKAVRRKCCDIRDEPDAYTAKTSHPARAKPKEQPRCAQIESQSLTIRAHTFSRHQRASGSRSLGNSQCKTSYIGKIKATSRKLLQEGRAATNIRSVLCLFRSHYEKVQIFMNPIPTTKLAISHLTQIKNAIKVRCRSGAKSQAIRRWLRSLRPSGAWQTARNDFLIFCAADLVTTESLWRVGARVKLTSQRQLRTNHQSIPTMIRRRRSKAAPREPRGVLYCVKGLSEARICSEARRLPPKEYSRKHF